MATTLTLWIGVWPRAYLLQVGDSRCYLLRNGEFQQVTEDHSWVAEQVKAGALTLEQAEQSPFRNVITRSMGGAPEVEPDLTAIRLEAGDRYLLCSDGLSGMVPDAEIGQLLAQSSPSVAAWNLVERANQYGGKDNITAMVLHVAEIIPWPDADPESETAHANGHSQPGPDAAAAVPVEPQPGPGKAGLMGRLFRKN
jgi:protein phosphatase